ncbi:MAG: MaoC family dehydratase N-terminal domain-containing protein [Rubrivivax sp.]
MPDPDAATPPAPRLQDWVGRQERREDVLHATPVQALAATLDHEPSPAPEGMPLPPLWHWLYFLPLHRARDIGPDGHARRGGFLPPVPRPRRMWAGSRFEFHTPLWVGQRVQRVSTIEAVSERQGRSGALVFVTVRHEFTVAGDARPALREWHDVVYREEPAPGTPAPAGEPAPAGDPTRPHWQRSLVPDEVLLFRYSALTFNGPRIHYDRRHVTQTEGYPGLVVHGPLIATLLLDLLRREQPDADLQTFSFKARHPCFDGEPLTLHGQPDATPSSTQPSGAAGRAVDLWAEGPGGILLMQAQAQVRLR